MDTLDKYFMDTHNLAMAVEVDVDVSGDISVSEMVILALYEDILNDYFPAA